MKFFSTINDLINREPRIKTNIDEHINDNDEANIKPDKMADGVIDATANNKKENNNLIRKFSTLALKDYGSIKVNKLIEAKDFKSIPSGRSYIIGSSVSASVGSNPGEDGWISQPLRSAKKGVGSEKEAPISIIANKEYTDLLKSKPLSDVRLAYDGLFKWILKQEFDLVLFCACQEHNSTWVSEILYQDGEIISIKERSLHEQNHAIFEAEFTELVDDIADRFPDLSIIFSTSDIMIPEALNSYRNIGDDPLANASGSLDFGHFRITKLTILPMIMAVFGIFLYISLFMFNLNNEMQQRVDQFNQTLVGIESEYEKGSNFIKLLQSQKALIRAEKDRIEPMQKIRLILSSLSTIDGLLLESITVKEIDDNYREAVISIIMMPIDRVTPSDQIVPVVNKLAEDIGLEVGAEKAGERNIASLSRNKSLTVATLVIKIPKVA